jgi:hypothetical protein
MSVVASPNRFEMGLHVRLRSKARCRQPTTSALPRITDICGPARHVGKVPIGVIASDERTRKRPPAEAVSCSGWSAAFSACTQLYQFLDPVEYLLIRDAGRHVLVMLDLAVEFDALLTHCNYRTCADWRRLMRLPSPSFHFLLQWSMIPESPRPWWPNLILAVA